MKRTDPKFLNIFIAVSVLFFIIAGVLLFVNPTKQPTGVMFSLSIALQILLGGFIIFYSLRITKKSYQLFIGALVFVWGLLELLFDYFGSKAVNEWWPLLGVSAGLVLFLSGLYKYRKIKFGYLFPSLCLCLMGIWYMLFTFQIIKYPFMTVVRYSCPVFFGIVAVVLVLFFFLQQKHKELAVRDDDQGVFADEEIQLEDD